MVLLGGPNELDGAFLDANPIELLHGTKNDHPAACNKLDATHLTAEETGRIELSPVEGCATEIRLMKE